MGDTNQLCYSGKMKIKGTHAGFTTLVNIGRNAFFIELDNGGVDMKPNDLAFMASNYNYVVISNIDKESVSEVNLLIKKVLSSSPKPKIELNINGRFMPPNAGSYERVIYNTFISPDVLYEKRFIKWLKDASSNFIFDIATEDNLENVNTFVRLNEIDKSRVILNMANINTDILAAVKLSGYNITFDMKEIIQNEIIE